MTKNLVLCLLTLLTFQHVDAADLQQDYFFDQAENLGIRFTLDSTRKSLRIGFLGHLADLNHHREKNAQEFIQFFKEKVSVRVNSKKIRHFEAPIHANSDKEPKWSIDLSLKRDGRLKPLQLAHWSFSRKNDKFKKNEAQKEQQCKMGTYLVRELAQFEDRELTFSTWINNDPCYDSDHFSPRVDLHTHYTGTHRSESLLALATESNIPVSAPYLTEMGIDPGQFKKASQGQVYLDEAKMSEEDKLKFKDGVSICPFKVITFIESEKLYANRKALIDRPAVSAEYLGEFKSSLIELAKDYKKNRVRYVEFSFSDIVQPEFIRIAHEVLPGLEEEYGVRIRFKAAIRRSATYDEMLKIIERVITLNDPYIVGADFMGEENNSTAAFAYAIKKLSEYRLSKRPHFAIQVHAGESDEFGGNVKTAIESGATQIGHGIHGITEEVIELARKNGVIIEINLDSNLALNNVARMDGLSQIVRKYLDQGIQVIFSTDGHGLYHSSSTSLYLALRRLGLTKRDFRTLRETEKAYMKKMNKAFKKEMDSLDRRAHEAILKSGQFKKPLRKDAQIQSRQKSRLQTEAQEKGLTVLGNTTELQAFESGKRPLFFMNAGSSAWVQHSFEQYQELTALIDGTLKKFDPKNYFVVTSGTAYGGDDIVYSHNRANLDRQWSILGITSLGVGAGRIERGNSALYFSKMDWIGRNNEVVDFLVKRGGVIVVIGGNEKGKQMLQTAFSKLEAKEKDSRFEVLVYERATGKISGIIPKFGRAALFSNVEALAKLAGSEARKAELQLVSKPIPSYCEIDSIQKRMTQEYFYKLPKGLHQNQTPESKLLKAKFEELLGDRTYFNHEYPEEYSTVLSQTIIQNEFERDQASFKTQLTLGLPGLIQFFSAMTDDEVFNYIRQRAERGKNMQQSLAKVCIYLSQYSKLNPQLVDSLVAGGLKVEPLDNEETEAQLLAEREKYRFFHLSGMEPPKTKAGKLAQRTLVLLRGIDGVEDFAIKVKKQIETERNDINVALVGTKAQFFDLKAKAFPNRRFWRSLRIETLQLNQQTTQELMKANTHIIVYADMNKSVSYMEPYAQLAASYGYQLKVIRVGDLSLQNIKRYVKKHATFMMEQGQWLEDSVLLAKRKVEQFIVPDDIRESVKYILDSPIN